MRPVEPPLTRSPARRLAGAILVLTTAAGCAATPPSASGASGSSVPAATLTDGTIGGLFLASNRAAIGYAGVALAKAVNPGVRQFAETMTNDHGALNKALTDLLARNGLVSIDNETSLTLRDDAEKMRDALQDRDGAAFDRFYMDNEIAVHTRLLQRLDRELIPQARNPDLKQFLTTVRPAVAAHLEHAKVVRRSL